MPARYPERIVCLTEETVETLYLLGEQDRIIGISGFTVRPPEARRTKPKVSAFTSAKHEKILALEPDLVFGFSDLQADIAAELVRRGANVYIANHRSVAGILDQILLLASMVGATAKGEALVQRLEAGIDATRRAAEALPKRPRVYFEEWDEPMISAIRWVSEIVGIAGGDDVFPELAVEPAGKDRIIARRRRADPQEPRADRRFVVRQEVPSGEGGRAARLGRHRRGARGPAARDQVAGHPAARSGGAHGRARAHGRAGR